MPVRVLAASPFVMQTSLGLFALTFGHWGGGVTVLRRRFNQTAAGGRNETSMSTRSRVQDQGCDLGRVGHRVEAPDRAHARPEDHEASSGKGKRPTAALVELDVHRRIVTFVNEAIQPQDLVHEKLPLPNPEIDPTNVGYGPDLFYYLRHDIARLRVTALMAGPLQSLAQQGCYMMFAIDRDGVPSVARWIHLR